MKDTQFELNYHFHLSKIPHKNTKYVIVSCISGNLLCDPCDYHNVQEIAKYYKSQDIWVEIAEFIETAKPAIDYSVLDMY